MFKKKNKNNLIKMTLINKFIKHDILFLDTFHKLYSKKSDKDNSRKTVQG